MPASGSSSVLISIPGRCSTGPSLEHILMSRPTSFFFGVHFARGEIGGYIECTQKFCFRKSPVRIHECSPRTPPPVCGCASSPHDQDLLDYVALSLPDVRKVVDD